MWSLPPGTYCVYYLHMCAYASVHMCYAQLLSRVWLFVTPCTVACPAHLSMGILQARILEWVAMPSSRVVFPTQGLKSGPPHCRRFFTVLAPREWVYVYVHTYVYMSVVKKMLFLEFTLTIAVFVPPEVISWNPNCILYMFIKCIYYSEGQGIRVLLQSMGSQWVQQDLVTDQQ